MDAFFVLSGYLITSLLLAERARHGRISLVAFWVRRAVQLVAWNKLLHAGAAKHPDLVAVLDLNKVACPGGRFTWTVNGVRIRSDGRHFTPTGVAEGHRPLAAAAAR